MHVGVKTDRYATIGTPGRLRSVDRRSSCNNVMTVRFSGRVGEMLLHSPIRFQIRVRGGAVRRGGCAPVRGGSCVLGVVGRVGRVTRQGALGGRRQERAAPGLVGWDGRQDRTGGQLRSLGEGGDGVRRGYGIMGELEFGRAAAGLGGVRVLEGMLQVVLLVFVLFGVVGCATHFTSRCCGDEENVEWKIRKVTIVK